MIREFFRTPHIWKSGGYIFYTWGGTSKEISIIIKYTEVSLLAQVGKKKGRSWEDGVRRAGVICAIGFRDDGRPVQKHRLIVRKIVFIVPPCTPGSHKWGDNFHCTPLSPTPVCVAHD